VWKRFPQSLVSFSSVENFVFQVFFGIKFQGESVWKRVLRVVENLQTLKFKKVCGIEFFDLLNV
jgi:hypothetical protein